MFSLTHLTFIFSWIFMFLNPVTMITEEISWKASRKLTWDDFKAKADDKDPLHAMTATNIDMKAKCEKGELKVKVESVFVTGESWSKNKKSDRLLFHEQLHFDITEIYARRLRKELLALKDPCSNPEEINKVTNRLFEEWKNQEDLYDKETDHGLKPDQMKVWADKITDELTSLEAYKEKD
ncbi:DUF922 domain-containing protein [Adhaeribacter soli]|uniref:DUF922 domain-containing protein n=1 Tax=Adhaeribacter soli TaxID=2607655 RepID=A0A5N1J5R5_9BACT|nr:DUF922 domain-containing protein [Adhaeribacter soli]KAA9346030.1 DUF922 domain-containing protein [Adhaeribacter soli]